MEKILVDKFGEITVFDTDDNTIRDKHISKFERIIQAYARVRKDGQVITPTQVIDVKAGDVVLTASYYDHKEDTSKSSAIVIHDSTAAYDFDEFERQMIEAKNYKKNG